MKKLYTAPQSEKVNLDPLMQQFLGATGSLSITEQTMSPTEEND